jgi:hypothetical protein
MTTEEIETEFGWCEDKIRALLRFPDSIKTRRRQHTEERYELYSRDRVLAASQTAEGRVTQREWDETKRGALPGSGWTTRLGDIARPLGITAVAVGKLLEQLGYRSDKRATARALTAGCGMRRWDGNLIHYDWRLDRVVAAIRLAAQAPGNAAVADALAAAIGIRAGHHGPCGSAHDYLPCGNGKLDQVVCSGGTAPGMRMLNQTAPVPAQSRRSVRESSRLPLACAVGLCAWRLRGHAFIQPHWTFGHHICFLYRR